MKKIIPIILLLSLAFSAGAQVEEKDPFELFKKNMEQEFDAVETANNRRFEGFRKQINDTFTEFLKKNWKGIGPHHILSKPKVPAPEPAIVPLNDNAPLLKREINPELIITKEPEPVRPVPVEPIISSPVEPESILPDMAEEEIVIPEDVIRVKKDPNDRYIRNKNRHHTFSLYGNRCRVRIPDGMDYSIPDALPEQIAEAWQTLSRQNYNDMLVDCLCIRESLQLSDWSMYELSKAISKAKFGNDSCNEAVLMQMYIFNQLGYKTRLARSGKKLHVLYAFNEKIYNTPFFTFDDTTYYIFSQDVEQGNMSVCDFEFKGETSASLYLKRLPVTPPSSTAEKRFCSKKYPELCVNVSSNQYLINFFEDFPQCDLYIKAGCPISESLKKQLYPKIREVIRGKSEQEAAGMILNFVQTGFGYMTDMEQFFQEKIFFADEVFYYDYCDCEDRSVLYSILLKDLMGLDVIFLEYPSHVATAVRFSSPCDGDFVRIDNEIYTICDPTYIGASVGKSMPAVADQPFNIIKTK